MSQLMTIMGALTGYIPPLFRNRNKKLFHKYSARSYTLVIHYRKYFKYSVLYVLRIKFIFQQYAYS